MSDTPSMSSAVEGSESGNFGVRDWGHIALTTLIFGTAFLWISLSLRSFPPSVIALARVALGAGALAMLKSGRGLIARSDIKRVIAAGLFGQAAPALLFAMAEERISSALTGMMISAVPIIAAMLAAFLTRKLPTGTRVAGLLVGLAGIGLLSAPALELGGSEAVGVGLVLLAVLGYALAALFYAPLQQRYGAISVTMWSLVVASISLAPLAVFDFEPGPVETVSVVALLILGVLGTGLARALLVSAMGRFGTVRSSMIGYLIPGVALLVGVVVLGESVEMVQVVGVAAALFGGYLLSRKPREATS
jgi:drug/metabolite transporter (DMT)-like permease